MNKHQEQHLSNITKKLGSAMDKFKFDGSLSAQEYSEIRQQLYDARSDIDLIGGIDQNISELRLFSQTADLLERALNAFAGDHRNVF